MREKWWKAFLLGVLVVPAWAQEPPISVPLSGGVTIEFVWIQPGSFTMGSPVSESGRFKNEGPQHLVTLSQGFYLGKGEITQAQWEAVMNTRPWAGQKWVQEYPGHPAVYISWQDVQEFIHRLNQAAGDSVYRLPTEAEWEYACRAGTTTRGVFGEDERQVDAYAWYDRNWNLGEKYAHSTGTKQPNPWGLYDLYGNVWEWAQDWQGDYTAQPQTDPTGPAEGAFRVVRGGNFITNARDLRSARRYCYLPAARYSGLGARLVRRYP